MKIMIPRMRGTITEITTPLWRFSFVGVHSILYRAKTCQRLLIS